METSVIDCYNLPAPISRYIDSDKAEISYENGKVILSPVVNKEDPEVRWQKIQEATRKIHELLKDNRYTSEDFIRDKAIEKELEKY
jgi:hypothetical protein